MAAKKTDRNPERESQAARTFLTALRTHGVADEVARCLAKQAAEIYARRLAKGRTKDARYILSNERAAELAKQLEAGLLT